MARIAKNETPADVLVVDDVAGHAEVMAEGLARAGHRCETAVTGPAAVERLGAKHFDVVVTDLVLGGAVDGLSVMRAAHEANPETQVILISAHGDIPTAVEATKRGAFNFIEKPIDIDLLRTQVNRAAEKVALRREVRDLRTAVAQRAGFEGIVGSGPAITEALELVAKIAPTRIPVLITGPNGCGKELIARAVHRNSPRANKRFVAINCAGIPETLLEDELFGHVKGVFTDARSDREGKFEYADGGTLFLDEIGDMPVQMQAKLLRALESGEVTRLGSNEPVHVDVRIVSATNQDLERLIAERGFRQDLYFRLKGAEIRVPALAERREDIRPLAEHFLAEAADVHGRPVRSISPEVAAVLENYPWPGNVRQLRQVMHLMVVLAHGEEITAADLPIELRRRDQRALMTVEPTVLPMLPMLPDAGAPGGGSLSDLEREAIRKALETFGGNRAKAARQLGMGERTLYRKLKEYGLG